MILPVLLVSCAKLQSGKQPVIATSFVTNAEVSLNDMSFSCIIDRTETSQISVNITAPEDLAGLSFVCQGEEITEKLGDLTYSVSPEEIPVASFILSLSSVFNAMIRVNELSVEVKDDGYKYKGSCKQGSFALVQNADYSYKHLELNDNLKIDFSDFKTN